MNNLCAGCAHAYKEYGQWICKFEGDNDYNISQEYIDGETVTECECYEEEVDYELG